MSGDKFVRTGPCPQCASLQTLTSLADDGAVFMRFCFACKHEWDKSAACLRVERMTQADFDQMVTRERAEDERLQRGEAARHE